MELNLWKELLKQKINKKALSVHKANYLCSNIPLLNRCKYFTIFHFLCLNNNNKKKWLIES